MAQVRLTVNVTVNCDSIADARRVGQSIDSILGSFTDHVSVSDRPELPVTGGAIRIQELPTFISHALYPEFVDKSKLVVGGQENTSKLQSFVKHIETSTSAASDGYWSEAYKNVNLTGQIDLEALRLLVNQHIDVVDTGPAGALLIAEAAAKFAENEMLRAIRPTVQKQRR